VLNSPGQPLNGGTRAFMEPRFGHDFSRVRVHADAKAAESAQAVNALAYTVGTDVVFGNGQYEPATANGQRLLGHELAHVVQQGAELQPQVIQRAETDTKGQCSKLKDIADDLNTYVNNSIKSVLSSSSEPFDSAEIVNKTFYSLARPQMVFLCPVEIWANNQPNKSGGGYSLPLFPITKGTKYEYASGSLLNYLAPAVNLNGNCVGTDKIGHMFQQGYQYFLVSESAKSTKKNVPEGAGKGDVYARAWGEWMEGVLSKETQKDPKLMAWLKDMSTKKSDWFTGYKQGYLGLAATGVHSRGDLSANNSGMKFYQDLQANPKMTFDIRKYISEDWDEEKSGNIYEHGVGEAVKKAKRLNPKDEILPK
jgi:hypothetical protein